MLGLALEGGGAKGAYEIGAYRALTELGYHFDVICGVSIGAINAALLAQGDCEKAAEFWETTANDDLFSEEDKGFLEIINRQVNLNTLSALKENIKAALENGGIDTSKIRAFLEQNIDPQRLLESPIDYGMIAVAFPELQPLISRLQEQNRTIRTQLSELSTRQREFDAITENMREGFLIVDNKCSILSSNRSALRLLGIDDAQKPENLHQAVCSGKLLDLVDNALAGTRGDEEITVGGGTWQLFANPVITAGHVTGAIIIFMDVTEREQREALRREFSANVSHELKTPLTSITGFAELMKEGMVPKEKMQEFSGDIYRESRRLIDLVDDIIQLSRLDEGTANFSKSPVDLYTLSGQVIESLRPVAQKQDITLTLSGQHAVIEGVEQLLQEMVYNLCDNAIKYNISGGSVTVSVWQNGQTVTLSVVDTGIGIPYADQSRVFERFYRVDKSHSKEVGGTGLGLSIVKHAAQYHGAKLELKSDPGRGTAIAVNFTVPV